MSTCLDIKSTQGFRNSLEFTPRSQSFTFCDVVTVGSICSLSELTSCRPSVNSQIRNDAWGGSVHVMLNLIQHPPRVFFVCCFTTHNDVIKHRLLYLSIDIISSINFVVKMFHTVSICVHKFFWEV